ncbi:transmembrane protein [Pelomyxa schiedti]|nr:transmembrane protein [Pelomyxa schiedti]
MKCTGIALLWGAAIMGVLGGVLPDPNTTDPTDYPMDTCKVRVYVSGRGITHYYNVLDECYNCSPELLKRRVSGETEDYFHPIQTRVGMNISVYDNDENYRSSIRYHFGEWGVYTLFVNSSSWEMTITEDVSPHKNWIPEIVFLLGLIFLFVLWQAFLVFRTYWIKRKRSTSGSPSDTAPAVDRIGSIDTFRGISLVIMIFVNAGGGGYWYMHHSIWNGLTVADLVFPWFVFLMGTSMALSFRRRKASYLELLKKITIRSLKLFCLGLFLNNGYCFFYSKITENPLAPSETEKPFSDILPYALQWLIILIFVTIWLLVTFLLDVPGCGRGYLGAGGLLGDLGMKKNCTGGAAGYIDRLILGKDHIYQWPTCKLIYITGPYDPEGILGYLTSFLMCYLGLQAGRILTHYKNHTQRISRWLIWGIVLGSIATALCLGRRDGGPIPVNKNLWSLSFVLALAGGANICLTVCYIVQDVLKLWEGEPFLFMGMNSISMYCLSEVFSGYFPFAFKLPDPTHWWKMLENVTCVSAWVIVSYIMWREKIFVSL